MTRTQDRQLVTVTNPVEAAQSEGLYIMSTKFAKNMKSKNGVVDVKIEDFWSGEFPHDGYMRMKAALTAIAYPLIDNAKFRNEGGRIVVSFPVEIKLPKELNRKDADFGVSALATF